MPRRFSLLLVFFAGLTLAPLIGSAQQPQPSSNGLAKFAGTWEGTCQDGRTFVAIVLRLSGGQLVGIP